MRVSPDAAPGLVKYHTPGLSGAGVALTAFPSMVIPGFVLSVLPITLMPVTGTFTSSPPFMVNLTVVPSLDIS